jgi:hypothetical protein
MKKGLKKMRLSRETLLILESRSLSRAVGGSVPQCLSRNPTACDPNSNCVSCLDTECGHTCFGTCPPCGP